MDPQIEKYDFVDDALKQFDAGVFADKFGLLAQDVAAAVHEFDKTGKVTIELSMTRIKNTTQIMCAHKLKVSRPTMHGNQTEEATTATALYVGRGGKMTIMPDNQTGFNFNKTE